MISSPERNYSPAEQPMPTAFDAPAELAAVRELSPSEQTLPSDKKRQLRRERLESFKDGLARQQLGIAELITGLRMETTAHPEATANELMVRVEAAATDLRLPPSQVELFRRGLDQYERQHAAVALFRELSPKDEELFDVCFGRRPAGQVEVLQRPMALIFRCHDPKDFAFAYYYSQHQGDETKMTPRHYAAASQMGGASLDYVRPTPLYNAVIIENVQSNTRRLEINKDVVKTQELCDDHCELSLDSQRGDVDIEVDGIGRWKVEMAERDADGFPTRLRCVDRGSDATVLLDATRAELANYNATFALRDGRRNFANVTADADHLQVSDTLERRLRVTYRIDETINEPDDEAYKRLVDHEEQHQFDRLFQPVERRRSALATVRQAVAAGLPPEQAASHLLRSLAMQERKNVGIDDRARDEILALYQDGTNSDTIFYFLTKTDAYDYTMVYQRRISRLPQLIREDLADLHEELASTGAAEGAVVVAAEAEAAGAVDDYIEAAMEEQLPADIKRWLGAITALERKGYTRDEIVSLLYQEPASAWANLARRLEKKGVAA